MLESLESRPGISSLSFACGFTASDIPHCGPSIVGYGSDENALDDAIETLYDFVLEREPAFASVSRLPVEAVAHAVKAAPARTKPIVLADVDDNAGGGDPSDTTWLLEALVQQQAEHAMLGVICDPDTAAAAHAAGKGARINAQLGGKSGAPGHHPFEASFEVIGLSDGRFKTTGVYFAGGDMDLGLMAALEVGGVQIVVSSQREQAADRAMFTHLGLQPERASILALKSSVHFRADFEPIASEIVEVADPNLDPVEPYQYHRLRAGVRVTPGGRTQTESS